MRLSVTSVIILSTLITALLLWVGLSVSPLMSIPVILAVRSGIVAVTYSGLPKEA
jgi:predicted neutral ceramidase superfamily lipid hydrolase